jgi:hypothetical protein
MAAEIKYRAIRRAGSERSGGRNRGADAALALHRRTSGVVRASELLVVRARAREARGDLAAAAADYDAAITALEHDEFTKSPRPSDLPSHIISTDRWCVGRDTLPLSESFGACPSIELEAVANAQHSTSRVDAA